MTSTEKIRVMIADDHPIVCRGLSAIIRAERGHAGCGRSGRRPELVEMFREHRPDVTLIDLRMPVMNGVEAVRAIRKEFPDAGILILTTYKGDEDIYPRAGGRRPGIPAQGHAAA